MRCFLPPERWREPVPALPPEEGRYAVQVLRAGVGDAVDLFDGEGRIAVSTIRSADRRRVTVELGPLRWVDPPRPALHLLQALPKSHKMDLIIQKGAELGMSDLWPLATEHAVVQLDDRRADAKTARWREIALNATRQCGRAWLPRIGPVVTPAQALRPEARPEVLLLADLRPTARDLGTTLRELKDAVPASIGVLIGPEGDFSAAERRVFDEAGAIPVSLGPTVLRTETAALYVLSVLRYEFL